MVHGWVEGQQHRNGSPARSTKLICPLAGQVVMPHNDRHPWIHIKEEQRFRLGRAVDPAISWYTPLRPGHRYWPQAERIVQDLWPQRLS